MVNEKADAAWDVLCVGEALLDFYPSGGARLETAQGFGCSPGGGAVNTAIALRHLGRSVALCAAVGEDALGRGLVARIAAEGVDTRFVRASNTLRTGLLFAGASNLSKEGEAQFLSYRTPQDEGRQMAKALPEKPDARALHLSGLLPIPAHMRMFRAALRGAESLGLFALLDVNARPRFWNRPDAHAIALLSRAYWVKASRSDLAVIRSSVEELRARMNENAVLIVTEGARAVWAFGPFGSFSCEAEPILGVDAHRASGAGDVFCAGLLDFVLKHHRGDGTSEVGLASVASMSKDAQLVRSAIERGIEVARVFLMKRGPG